mgnify:CR=1 FL=1
MMFGNINKMFIAWRSEEVGHVWLVHDPCKVEFGANYLLTVSSKLSLTLGDDISLDTVILRDGDPVSVLGTDNESVFSTGGELCTGSILDVDNVERTRVLIDSGDNTNTTSVVTTGDHSGVTDFVLEVTNNLASFEVNLDGVTLLEEWVSKADGTTIVGLDVRDCSCSTLCKWVAAVDTLGSLTVLDDTAELVLCINIVDLVEDKVTLGVEHDTESLVCLRDGQNITETNSEVSISTDLTIDLDETAGNNGFGFTCSECKLEAVTDDDSQWETFAQLVWADGWTCSKDTTKLGEHPVLWGVETLKMLLWTSSHA